MNLEYFIMSEVLENMNEGIVLYKAIYGSDGRCIYALVCGANELGLEMVDQDNNFKDESSILEGSFFYLCARHGRNLMGESP